MTPSVEMTTAATTGRDCGATLAGYVATPLAALRSLSWAAADLYVRYDPHAAPTLYCPAGWPLESTRLRELASVGVSHLLVRSADFFQFSDELLQSLETLLQQEEVPTAEKFAALQTAVAAEIEQALLVGECSRYCQAAKKISEDLVRLLQGSQVLPSDLFSLARHDFYTFTHVTNVASYAVVLAEHLGVSDERALSEIAHGAMLHDIGKRHIPARILTKPGRLTDEERSIIELHPRTGYEELCRRGDLNFGQLMMVYQHHERMDGGGYPVGITAEEIHDWARLLAIVDVFEAITSLRPYRRPMTRDAALVYQHTLAGTHFDAEMLRCWIAAMSPR
jgi:HD-GYP domain-containing protein (c-di-GMP phosphodiesterase class II)